MNVEHPDITLTLLTGYPQGQAPLPVSPWKAQGVPSEDVFPYEPDEREEY